MGEFQTHYRRQLEERNSNLYREYLDLVANSSNQKVPVIQHIMRKYRLSSMGSVYAILRKQRAKEEAK